MDSLSGGSRNSKSECYVRIRNVILTRPGSSRFRQRRLQEETRTLRVNCEKGYGETSGTAGPTGCRCQVVGTFTWTLPSVTLTAKVRNAFSRRTTLSNWIPGGKFAQSWTWPVRMSNRAR